MNILITGVSGLLGTELVKQLLQDATKSVTGIIHSHDIEGITTYRANILDYDSLEKIFKENHFDVVIHMAAISDYLSSTEKKNETFQINMQGTINMIELFNKYCESALFIYTSSCKVYGQTNEMPITEKALVNPLTVVGKTKCIAEKIIDFYIQSGNKYLIVRPFNIFGGNQKESFLIPTLIKQLKQSNILKLGNIYDKRDYIYVKDVASAIVSCIENRNHLSAYECLNIGSGRSCSVEDILKIFEKLLKIKIQVEVNKERLRNDETSIEYADCEKIKQLTGWEPHYSLEEALKEICFENELI